MIRTEHAKTFDMKSDSIHNHEGEQPPSTHSTFLSRKPLFSKTQVNKQGSQWRDGEKFNSDVLDEFLAYNAELIEELIRIIQNAIGCLIRPMEESVDSSIEPDSDAYVLTARVKTKDTLLVKLRRMKTTPVLNIHDVAGIRFDCDMSLSEQLELAEYFAMNIREAGATRVDVKDFRLEPHSGYRAVHLHIRSAAGRAELQIRTALQSKWANLYEEAGDVLGRDIRYLHEGAEIPSGADKMVRELHDLSTLVRRVEELSDVKGKTTQELKELRQSAYDIMNHIHSAIKQIRTK